MRSNTLNASPFGLQQLDHSRMARIEINGDSYVPEPKRTPAPAAKLKPKLKQNFFDLGAVLYNKNGYRVTVNAPGVGKTIGIYVNGRLIPQIKIDIKLGEKHARDYLNRLVERGDFKHLQITEQERNKYLSLNRHVYIPAYQDVGDKVLSSIIDEPVNFMQGKRILPQVSNAVDLVERLSRDAAINGTPFKMTINSHGSDAGIINLGKDTVSVDTLIKSLIGSGALKAGGTIVFSTCLVGQQFKMLRDAAKEYGITIQAPNYIHNPYGVVGGRSLNSIIDPESKNTREKYPQLQYPKKPDVLSFKPNGKVYGSDGVEVFSSLD